jgi:hypothetical protein
LYVCVPAPAVGEKKRLASGVWHLELDVPFLLPVPSFSRLIDEPIGAPPYDPNPDDTLRPPFESPM